MKPTKKHTIQLRQGYKDGYNHGFDQGFNKGYDDGYDQAREKARFSGTSIIIPTYNQLNYLKQCVESIVSFTDAPYEIIIIDNGSTDGTVEYLQSLTGQLRVRLNKQNLGFARAINQGLFLSAGSTVMFLNNDAVVTENWLSNLLNCVQSDDSIGIAGPVTNYISGDQLIEVAYRQIADMHRFARHYNQSDAKRWVETTRLTGFCMLMRRDVFERIGYLDEGFKIGNCEDDDYCLRARLLGLRLVIAKDTFIHHYGSVSMKALESNFDPVYKQNLNYYSQKWGRMDQELTRSSQSTKPLRMSDFYPTHVVVKDHREERYWLENGKRYTITNATSLKGVRISKMELANYPLENEISLEEYREKLDRLQAAQSNGSLEEGVLLKSNQQVYQFREERLHRLASEHAYHVWFYDRSQGPLELNHAPHYPLGNLLIAPIEIESGQL